MKICRIINRRIGKLDACRLISLKEHALQLLYCNWNSGLNLSTMNWSCIKPHQCRATISWLNAIQENPAHSFTDDVRRTKSFFSWSWTIARTIRTLATMMLIPVSARSVISCFVRLMSTIFSSLFDFYLNLPNYVVLFYCTYVLFPYRNEHYKIYLKNLRLRIEFVSLILHSGVHSSDASPLSQPARLYWWVDSILRPQENTPHYKWPPDAQLTEPAPNSRRAFFIFILSFVWRLFVLIRSVRHHFE